mgnify:CR=1 FL=1|tara:strand:+ start:2405 stop:3595 length:1191 start_codon:yes stop_codon:yes gene_type:complete
MNAVRNAKIEPYTAISIGGRNNIELLDFLIEEDSNLTPRKVDKSIVIYGGGKLGEMAKSFFDQLNIKVSYLVDQHAEDLQNKDVWKDISVNPPADVPSFVKENMLLVVCIVTVPLIPLKEDLQKAGWMDVAFFYDVCEAYRGHYPLNNGWMKPTLSKNDQDNIKRVFSTLDFESQRHYLQFIAWRKHRLELAGESSRINIHNRFFIPEIESVFTNNECFFDAGAHVGTVIDTFTKLVDGSFRTIIAVEPDIENLKALRQKVAQLHSSRISDCALGERNTTGEFEHGYGFSSQLSEGSRTFVTVKTIDSFKENITFLKLHLEGAELGALKGATKTIAQHRPIIAVTVYHNDEGLWEIPKFIMNLVTDYCFLFRVHCWAGTGAVFYAIPNERKKSLIN